MAPRAEHYKRIRQRMRRTLHYGERRMDNLSLPLSKFVVDYFDKNSCFDYMDMDYATKLSKDGCISPCTLIAAMIYLERLKQTRYAEFQQSNAAELYLSAVVVATKLYNDAGLDEYVYNDEWAISAGTSTSRVNALELKLLNDLDWKLLISAGEFEETLNKVERWVASENVRTHGFFTYNDMNVLSGALTQVLLQHIQRLVAFFGLVGLAYLFGISSVLLASTAIQSLTTVAPANYTTPEAYTVPVPSQQRDLLSACLKKRLAIVLQANANDACTIDTPTFLNALNESRLDRVPLGALSYPLITSG
ncbi:cyclin domain-containing protein [Aphelenchoides avenae]|nr:cyclin domain-containing protein [Aphelenchus avenae]